jgi:large subunit ribosomal protein L20
MSRVKKGVNALKRRRSVLGQTKGFRFGRSTKERQAKEALVHAGKYSFRDRRAKKRTMRGLWNIKIGAGLKTSDLSYSKLMGNLKKQKIEIDRKVLSQIAEYYPETWTRIIEKVK